MQPVLRSSRKLGVIRVNAYLPVRFSFGVLLSRCENLVANVSFWNKKNNPGGLCDFSNAGNNPRLGGFYKRYRQACHCSILDQSGLILLGIERTPRVSRTVQRTKTRLLLSRSRLTLQKYPAISQRSSYMLPGGIGLRNFKSITKMSPRI